MNITRHNSKGFEHRTSCQINAFFLALIATMSYSFAGDSLSPAPATIAIAHSDVQAVKQILQNDPSLVTGTDSGGFTIFGVVASEGRLDLAQLLLSDHADVNIRDRFRGTPVYWAAISGQAEMVKFLVANKADINAANEYGNTALHDICSRGAVGNAPDDMVRLLLSLHADVDAKNDLGGTPLDEALIHKNLVELMLPYRANINAKEGNGRTLLHGAAILGQTAVVELLLSKGADIDAKDNDGMTALDLLAFTPRSYPGDMLGRHDDVIALLRSNHARYSAFDAVAIGDVENAKKMILQDQSLVTAKDGFGRTLLHYAAEFEQKDFADVLIANHAVVDASDNFGQTPLHLAADVGNADIVELLLANHANVNARGGRGETPLHMAAQVRSNHADVVRILLEHGADVNAKTNDGSTPLATAVQNSAAAKVLIQYGGHF
jgi:serine/threonine-protein phosphatase 6 regulatory ankyrin repeat subunit B